MMTTPNTRSRVVWLRRKTLPSRAAPTPSTVKTVVNPATNSSEARRVTPRAWRSPSSDTGRADTYDR